MDGPPNLRTNDTCRLTHHGDAKTRFSWRSRWVGIAAAVPMVGAMSLHAIFEESFPIELALLSGMVLCLVVCWLLRRHVAPTIIESTPDTKSNRESIESAKHLLSRPSGTLSSTQSGGEGRGEVEPQSISPTFMEKGYDPPGALAAKPAPPGGSPAPN